MARGDGQANFARWCRLVRLGALVTFAGLAALIGIAVLAMIKGATGEPAARGLWAAVQFSPALGYAWALWAVQRALADLGAGTTFSPTVARAMRHMGYGVIVGALLSVFAVTNLSRVLMHGRGSFMFFDMSGIVLVVVGAALILLARLIDRARLIESELDEIL